MTAGLSIRPAGLTSKPTYIHATAIMIGEAGLLIRGPSRAGKSSLALALLDAATRRSNYARLIGDDRIGIESRDGCLILRGHPAIHGKIERRGEGILDVAWEPFAIAKYVIDLAPSGEGAAERMPIAAETAWLEGIELPLFSLSAGQTAGERAEMILSRIRDYETIWALPGG